MLLHSSVFMCIKPEIYGSFFLGYPECQKHACVPCTVSLGKHRRCCSDWSHHLWNAQVLGRFAMTPSLLGSHWRRWCEKQQLTAGSQGTCKREVKFTSVKEVSSHRHFLSLLVAKQSLPVWKTSFWCTGLEVFDLEWDLQGLEHGALLHILFLSWPEENKYLWLLVTAEVSC